MNTVATSLPGLSFTRAPRQEDASPLRSDVAGFVGRTRRGPIGEVVRVEGWREYLRIFGGLDSEANTPYALRGYFENGGQIAYIVRLDSSVQNASSTYSRVTCDVTRPDNLPDNRHSLADPPPGFLFKKFEIVASSPGAWAEGTTINMQYRLCGISGGPEIDLAVDTPEEATEILAGLPLNTHLDAEIKRRSRLIRLVQDIPVTAMSQSGPNRLSWRLELKNGMNGTKPAATDYLLALAKLNDRVEISMICLPDLHRDIEVPNEVRELLKELTAQADELRDRLVLIDSPDTKASGNSAVGSLVDWIGELRGNPPASAFRAAAIYHPWLEVADPLGGVIKPLRRLPPCGHIAGAISRLDRERGPHYSPANAPILDAADLATHPNKEEQLHLNANAVNLLRCLPGQGLLVWGASTLLRKSNTESASQPFSADHFIAYRRLIHRLVRAIRRVAEPLVFDTNGPELWLAFVRAVTGVLLESYRGGALKGARPDEAFRVRCDDTTNPPEEIELGCCMCEIAIAPAAPMEFIELRIALGSAGTLEVFES